METSIVHYKLSMPLSQELSIFTNSKPILFSMTLLCNLCSYSNILLINKLYRIELCSNLEEELIKNFLMFFYNNKTSKICM